MRLSSKILAASLAATLSLTPAASALQSLGVAPITALAANTVSTYDELKTACSKGGTYTITKDIKITKALTVSKNLTLVNKSEENIIHCTDEMTYLFKVDGGATLKLGSATADANRVIIRGGTGDAAKATAAIIVADNGSTVVINRARIYRSNGSAIKVKGSSNLIMNENTSTGTGNIISGITPAKSYYGAVHVCENSTFTMKGGTIGSKDASNSAGGVTIKPGSSMTMSGGTIHYNMGGAGNPTVAQDGNTVCTGYGAGIYNAGTLNMTGGTICDNNATVNGGGVYNNGTFRMSGGTIKNNHSTKPGQGIFISEKGKMDLSGSALVDTSNDIAFASETTPINVSSLLTNKPAVCITLPRAHVGAQVATVTAGQDAQIIAESIDVNNKEDAIVVGKDTSIILSKYYTLSYDVDCDGNNESSTQLLYNDTFVVPAKGTISPKLGYDLAIDGLVDANGNLYVYGNTYPMVQDLVLTGKWTAKNYTVSYDANTTNATINIPNAAAKFDTGFTVDFVNIPTREGYTFIGWADNKDDADLNRPTYTAAQLVQYKYETDTTLYACWQPKNITITYNTGDGSVIESTVGNTDAAPTVTTQQPASNKEGFVFDHWEDLQGNVVPGGNTIRTDTTLVAIYRDTTSTWKIQMENPSTKTVTLFSDVNANIKYNTTLKKALKFTLTGTRTNSEGTKNVDYYEYQLVKNGKEMVSSADAWKQVGNDNTITIKNTTAARLYIRAHVGDVVTVYKTSGFIVDTTKPTVKGVKNGKTYKKAVTIRVKDSNTGIKSIKLNGKKIKATYKLKKKGSYKLVVMDKAGNKTTIKFKIKK